jgi:hypothetical protein
MKESYLIYVNMVGENYKGQYLYEFIFSDSKKDIDGEDWDTYPASGRPKPPFEKFIKRVGVLTSQLKLDVVQKSDTFAVWDAVDDVIALAWENVNAYETYPDPRLNFRFGETEKAVADKLYAKDLILDFNSKTNEKPVK